ncbi:MAG: DUF1499 domain-containing protein [Hyphomicrobiaceae bacterium]|nr:DUF1499 domain-containing protein [Hyphomicrobiaceae bacterium]
MRNKVKPIRSGVWTMHLGLFTASITLLTIIFHRTMGLDTLVALNLFILSFVTAGFVFFLGIFTLTKVWKHGKPGGSNALMGMLVAVVLLMWPLIILHISSNYPAINDITTDLSDPPQFVMLHKNRPPGTNSLTYPGEILAAQQREAYKNINSLQFNRSSEEILKLVKLTLLNMNMSVVGVMNVDNTEFDYWQIEAIDRTSFIGFIDDVVVRVKQTNDKSVVDIRSLSRYGKFDLGCNAGRIEKFQQELISKVLSTVPTA